MDVRDRVHEREREREREREVAKDSVHPCIHVKIKGSLRATNTGQSQFSFTPADLSAVDNASHIEMQPGS